MNPKSRIALSIVTPASLYFHSRFKELAASKNSEVDPLETNRLYRTFELLCRGVPRQFALKPGDEAAGDIFDTYLVDMSDEIFWESLVKLYMTTVLGHE